MKEVKFIDISNRLELSGIVIHNSTDSVPAFVDPKSEDFKINISEIDFSKSVHDIIKFVLDAREKHVKEIQDKKNDEADTAFLTKLFKKEADCYGTSYNKEGRAMFEETFIRVVKEFLKHDR